MASRPWLAETLYIDVTVRNPLSERYLREGHGQSSSNTDGYALQCAVSDKQKRYPPKAGISCTAAAAEAFGRVGEDFLSLMDLLASAASLRDSAFCMPAVGWRRKWEESLSVTVQRSVARSFLDALGSDVPGPKGFRGAM